MNLIENFYKDSENKKKRNILEDELTFRIRFAGEYTLDRFKLL